MIRMFNGIRAVLGKSFDDNGDSFSRKAYIRSPVPITRKQAEFAADYFNYSCNCQHDCCGHWQHTAWLHTLRSNKRGTRWTVRIGSYQNV